MLCSPEGETLTVAVLLPPDENARVDALEPDQIFEATLTLLDFDTLYQRTVFGQSLEDSVEAEPEEKASPEVEDSVPEETTGEPEQQAPAEEPLPQEEPTAVTPEAPAEIPLARPEPAPSKPEEPAKFTITSSPAPPQGRPREKPMRSKDSVRPTSPRSGKRKQSKLFRLKESLGKKIKKLKHKSCPNGHGPLTYYQQGKRYCKVCGWPSHKPLLKLDESPEEQADSKGCIRIAICFFILFAIVKSCS